MIKLTLPSGAELTVTRDERFNEILAVLKRIETKGGDILGAINNETNALATALDQLRKSVADMMAGGATPAQLAELETGLRTISTKLQGVAATAAPPAVSS